MSWGLTVDVRLMRYVVAIADEGSFQRAAERLHMAQPPLSRQIRDLERTLGVTLFERRPTRLTEAGEVFVQRARRVLADADLLVEHTRQAGRGELGSVRLGYSVTAAYETLPKILADLRLARPGLGVEATEDWTRGLENGLADNLYDLVLARGIAARDGLERVAVRREPFVALVASDHPLAGCGQVALSDFRGERFTFFARELSPTYHDFVLAALTSTGETFEVWENPVPGMRHLSLREEGGFTLAPRSVAEHMPAGAVGVALTDPLPTIDLELVWRTDAVSVAAKTFVDTALATATAESWLPTA